MRYITTILLGALLIFSCSKYDEVLKSRSNPYDAGGDSWSINTPPTNLKINYTANIRNTAVWSDFNFSDTMGTILLTFSATDLNENYDTLNYTIYFGKDITALDSITTTTDTFLYIDSLLPTTFYNVMIKVSDYSGDTTSATISFQTPDSTPPPPPANFYYTTTENAITLSWTASTTPKTYVIYRQSSGYGLYEKVDTTTNNSFVDSSLGNTIYNYVVSTKNIWGEARSASQLIMKNNSTISFTAPTVYVSKGTFIDKIQLNWSSDPIGNYNQYTAINTYPSKYYILRSKYVDKSFEIIDSICESETESSFNYDDISINDYDTYYYKLIAYDSLNNGAIGPVSNGGSIIIPKLGAISVSTTLGKYIKLTWNPVANANMYIILKADSYNTDTFNITDTIYNDTVYIDSQVIAGTSSYKNYYYKVIYVDTIHGANNSANTTYYAGYTLRRPYNLKALSTSDCIKLSWTQNEYFNYYKIYRSTNDTTFTLLDTTTVQWYNDTVSQYLKYYYKVTGIKGSEESMFSNCDSAGLLPKTPDTITVADSANFVYITWNKSIGADGYYIYRALNRSSNYAVIDTTTSSIDTTYKDSSIVNSTDSSYIYKVMSYNSYGTSNFTQITQAGTYLRPPSIINLTATGTPAHIAVTWKLETYTNGINIADRYVIYRTNNPSSKFDSIGVSDTTVYYDTVLDANNYWYKVAGINNAGIGVLSDSNKTNASRTAPKPPDSVKASDGLYKDSILITWQPSIGASEYSIERSTVNNSSTFRRIATVSDTFFYNAVSFDSTYFYRVKSQNVIAQSSASTVNSGIRKPSVKPLTPRNFSASTANGYVSITWSNPPDTSVFYAGYILYRKDTISTKFSIVDTIVAGTTSYRDTPYYTCPDKYIYKLTSYNINGESQFTAPDTTCRN